MSYKLLDMISLRWRSLVTIALPLVWVLAACRGDRRTPAGDTSALGATGADTSTSIDSGAHWNVALGRVLVLAISSSSDDVVVLPPDYVEGRYDDTTRIDLRRFNHVTLDLFGRGGIRGTTTLSAQQVAHVDPEGGCSIWPTGKVTQAQGGWSVGLESGHASVIRLDSIQTLASADSSKLAMQIVRMASTLPVTRDSVFSSIPFVVQSAFRFQTGTIEGIIATVRRTIPSEADPREDHTMFIAERPVGSTQPYQVAFVKRDAGEANDTFVVNVLAALTLTEGQRPVLVVVYEYDEGESVGVIERTSPGQWQATWTSAYTGC